MDEHPFVGRNCLLIFKKFIYVMLKLSFLTLEVSAVLWHLLVAPPWKTVEGLRVVVQCE